MLQARLVLIVEDEPIVAMDLVDAVEKMGGQVMGPFATVRATLENLDRRAITAAILDATLLDRDVTPVALRLAEAGIPLVIHSGTGLPRDVAAKWPDLPVLAKPIAANLVVERLLTEIDRLAPDVNSTPRV